MPDVANENEWDRLARLAAEPIRAEAVERLARARFERVRGVLAWDEASEAQDYFRSWANYYIDALGDLLPTSVEHQYPWRAIDLFGPPAPPQEPTASRYVCDWRSRGAESPELAGGVES